MNTPKPEYTFGSKAGDVLLEKLQSNKPLLKKFAQTYHKFSKACNVLEELKDKKTARAIEQILYKHYVQYIDKIFTIAVIPYNQYSTYAFNSISTRYKKFHRTLKEIK